VDLSRLAYEASLRSLDKQEQVVQELRNRTGLLLAAASLAASFLGDAALDGSVLLAIPALVAFATSLGGSLYVLVPKDENDAILARLLTAFRVAAIALGAEVVLLLASAGTTIL
jgi:hypothetical protein